MSRAGGKSSSSSTIPRRLFLMLTVAVVVSLSTLRNSMELPYYTYNLQSQEEPQHYNETVTVTRTTVSTPKICFVTSIYAKWVSNADKVMNVTKWKEKYLLDNSKGNDEGMVESFEFLVYTNLPNLKTPGWTKIVKPIANVTRYATQSRWPKFLAWQDERIYRQPNTTTTTKKSSFSPPPSSSYQCQVVFYLDAIGNLIGTPHDFQEQARRILENSSVSTSFSSGGIHNVGWAQYPHRGGGGIPKEFRRIEVAQKDTPEHIQASMEWLQAQPDYRENCTLYENRFFAYDVSSIPFQKASTFFWNRYSLEEDSWRDQPLWCYVLDHFQFVPLLLPQKELFGMDVRRMAKKKHKLQTNE